ncbi:MAG: ACP phosphodiesterase [Chitinophagaceae bacterium]
MNFLAHAYLSFGHPQVLTGNMISDFVKGRAKFDFPPGIQKGIALHRAIDAFTDVHGATKEAMEIFRPHYRLYSGAIMDVLYDHFLASDETIFTTESLHQFTQQVYTTLEKNALHLPPPFAHTLLYMKSENWLYHYSTTAGIEKSLRGLSRRAAYMPESETAMQLFEQHYNLLKSLYVSFMADVKLYAKQQFEQLPG